MIWKKKKKKKFSNHLVSDIDREVLITDGFSARKMSSAYDLFASIGQLRVVYSARYKRSSIHSPFPSVLPCAP